MSLSPHHSCNLMMKKQFIIFQGSGHYVIIIAVLLHFDKETNNFWGKF